MARKKTTTTTDITTQPEESASATEQRPHKATNDQQLNTGAEARNDGTSPSVPDQQGDGQRPRFIRDTFTSTAAGVRAGEDKRFNAPQVFVDFDDDKRATLEEKAELARAGLRYRPKDKGYSAPANTDTRQARDELAQKFTDRRLKERAEQGECKER